MKDFIQILKRFVPPYRTQLILSIIMNILSALLFLVSFSFIIPILELLFKVGNEVYEYVPVSFESINSFKETLKQNSNWHMSQIALKYGTINILYILGTFLILTTILRTGVMYLATYFMIPIRTGVLRDMRNQINDKIISLPLAFFSEEKKGDILARMSGDVNEVENSIMSSLDMLFKNPVMLLIYLIGMLVISWQLTLFVLLVLPLAGYIMGQIGKSLKKTSFDGQQQWGALMAQIEETLGGLRIIKAFNAENKISRRFKESNNTFRNTTNRIFRRQQLAHPVSELLGTLTIAIVLCYGGYLILSDSSPIEGSTFVYYLTIFYGLINPAKELSKAAYSIQKGLASMERIDKILMAKTSIVDPKNPQEIQLKNKISYNNIWFKYREEWIIKGVSLDIPNGSTIALVGQSGSGKSTMVDLLPRFYDIQQGNISIDGVDIRNTRVKDLRELMGIVNQEAILFNDTFFNNIAFGVKNAKMEDVIEAAKIANAYDFIMASEDEFETNIGDRGCKLSGGQRQRISIARAVLKNPPILILDEATSALDTESERLVQEALEKLMINRTTIIVAHRLSTIKDADMICVMNEGQIVEKGTHNELISLNGYYTKLCAMQSF